MNIQNLKALSKSPALPNFADHFFVAPKSFFDANGIKSPVKVPNVVAIVHADIATRDGSTPSANDICEVTDDGQGRKRFYQYDGTVWFEISEAVVAETHLFTGTLGFVRVENTNDRRTIESEHPSVDDVHGEMPMFKFSLPGINQDNLEFANMITKEGCIIIAPRLGGQDPLQIGTADSLVTIKKSATQNGGGGLDYAGFDFEAKAFMENLIIYKGAITQKS